MESLTSRRFFFKNKKEHLTVNLRFTQTLKP